MKLLGWMHRKFRQNSTEPFKDLVIGQPALDDEHNYPKPKFGTKHVKQIQRDHNLRKSFAGLETARIDDDYEEESSAAMYELFHGFLAIGTLGSEQVITDPSTTPTFGISVENITEKEEDEATENELKLINDELEKVLGAETKDDGSIYSSGRNSHVSTGRSSHGSIVTLGGKPLEGTESNGNGTAFYPLQGYLFGSAIELAEPTTTVAKKEHRTSLGELFQKSKLAEENCGAKCEKDDKRTERDADNSAMHLMMKKLLKKRMLHTSSRSGGPVDFSSAERKLHKILHLFHRKVHPENSAAVQKSDKYEKNDNRKKTIDEGSHVVHPGEDIMTHPKRAVAKENKQKHKSQSNPLQLTLGSEDSCENREHWIKTDADYLVLEL
ncbi:protein LAZY 1-like isoform X2 [Gastrolobium bilobum]|uniref:protein LAZY 1-like isoform X2 n=1 Tax=Gastrolobium bilobum TaxID=150636 RepID=UPI002AAF6186|nr:protein LAZY 1-like isoform X2 [Gastrolobium bilobum]